jgi:hypothetical protein
VVFLYPINLSAYFNEIEKVSSYFVSKVCLAECSGRVQRFKHVSDLYVLSNDMHARFLLN